MADAGQASPAERPGAAALLRLCAAPDDDHGALLSGLDVAEWDWLATRASDLRLAPLLQRAMARAQGTGAFPEEPTQRIAAMANWHRLYTLRQAVGLSRTLDTLATKGLQPVVLKGFSLAYGAYPTPELRPLRDMDLLLPPEQAQAGYDLLAATEGFRRAPWAAPYGMEFSHQFPELQEVATNLTIEVHHRLNARNWDREHILLEDIRSNVQTLRVLDREVRVPSRAANFLHLVEHSTLHHLFANGPLVLADLHYLAQGLAGQWEQILTLAERTGLGRSLALVAQLSRVLGASWPDAIPGAIDPVSPAYVAAAREMLVLDDATHKDRAMMRRQASRSGRATGLLAALSRLWRPNPILLAKTMGVSPDSPLRWLGYPAWLFDRGRHFLAAGRANHSEALASREVAMLRWLAEDQAD